MVDFPTGVKMKIFKFLVVQPRYNSYFDLTCPKISNSQMRPIFLYENPLVLFLVELSLMVVLVGESSLVLQLVVRRSNILDPCNPWADAVDGDRPNRDKKPRRRLLRQLSQMSRHPRGWLIITSSFNEILKLLPVNFRFIFTSRV